MKKRILLILLTLVTVLASQSSHAQNYKHQTPSIDAKGKITDAQGKHIGWVTSDGIIKDASGKDASGTKIAHIDNQGNAVDAKTGKTMGKAAKNGTYLYHLKSGVSDSLTVSVPMNGVCEVKDKNGKTVLVVHENYKQYGACALHCLQMKNEHKDMKMK